jgi:predicted DNA binding CopG/RHH family protein
MSAIEALRAIIEEVAGVSQPYSTDSYLPASLVHDARQVIEQYEREQEADENHIGRLSPTELSADAALIQDSLGLQPISIRLEKTLIEGFKTIATIEGLGYQTIMRRALRRFAIHEMKRVTRCAASDMQQYEREQEAK